MATASSPCSHSSALASHSSSSISLPLPRKHQNSSAISFASSIDTPSLEFGCNLIVQKLPQCVDEAALLERFSKYGVIVRVKVIRKYKTGRSLSYGFVVFAHSSDAKNARISEDNAIWGENTIRVQVAKSDQNNHHTPHHHTLTHAIVDHDPPPLSPLGTKSIHSPRDVSFTNSCDAVSSNSSTSSVARSLSTSPITPHSSPPPISTSSSTPKPNISENYNPLPQYSFIISRLPPTVTALQLISIFEPFGNIHELQIHSYRTSNGIYSQMFCNGTATITCSGSIILRDTALRYLNGAVVFQNCPPLSVSLYFWR